MTQTVTRQIVGYDPTTETVAYEHCIPAEKWGDVLALIHKNDDDPDCIYNYPLDARLANNIMLIIGSGAAQNLNYFLEADTID